MPNQSQKKLDRLMDIVIDKEASDLHLGEGRVPTLRIDGELSAIRSEHPLTAEEAEDLAEVMMTEEEKRKLDKEKTVDFSYTFEDKGRFRVNIYYQKGYVSAALRLIPSEIMSIEELHLPEILHKFCLYNQGFFLVVGPAGHGKTTALAAMINEINRKRQDHIITIEDPIEYLFTPQKCIIDQREVGRDTTSFSAGLRSSLRQDPDVIMVGEMRGQRTISAALTAAETGHLVFTTLHTNDAPQTIDRIVDTFPADQQSQVRSQLASSLAGVLSRRLIQRKEGGIINAVELLIANSAVRNLIREGKIHQISSIIETSQDEGMISLNRSLANLVQKGEISLKKAQTYSQNSTELKLMLNK